MKSLQMMQKTKKIFVKAITKVGIEMPTENKISGTALEARPKKFLELGLRHRFKPFNFEACVISTFWWKKGLKESEDEIFAQMRMQETLRNEFAKHVFFGWGSKQLQLKR